MPEKKGVDKKETKGECRERPHTIETTSESKRRRGGNAINRDLRGSSARQMIKQKRETEQSDFQK